MTLCVTSPQASSPDEEALVQGAAYLGYELLSRTTDVVKVRVHGAVYTYDILATLEFNSDRKRMSIIVRGPDGRIQLMCKGADSMILARLKDKSSEEVQVVQQHLVRVQKHRSGFCQPLAVAVAFLLHLTTWAVDGHPGTSWCHV